MGIICSSWFRQNLRIIFKVHHFKQCMLIILFFLFHALPCKLCSGCDMVTQVNQDANLTDWLRRYQQNTWVSKVLHIHLIVPHKAVFYSILKLRMNLYMYPTDFTGKSYINFDISDLIVSIQISYTCEIKAWCAVIQMLLH